MMSERFTVSSVTTSKTSLHLTFLNFIFANPRLYAVKCAKCHQPIVPDKNKTSVQRLRALDQDFHTECFCCDVSSILKYEHINNSDVFRHVVSSSWTVASRLEKSHFASIAMRTEEKYEVSINHLLTFNPFSIKTLTKYRIQNAE